MALNVYRSPGAAAALSAFIPAARQLYSYYRNYNRVRSTIGHIRSAAEMVKRKYTGSYKSPAPKRTRFTRSRPQLRRRRFKRKPAHKFAKRRNRGRKTYGNRTMTFLREKHRSIDLELDTNKDWKPIFQSLGSVGDWFPSPSSCDDLKICKFDKSSCKKLASAAVYLKDIRYTSWIQSATGAPPIEVISRPSENRVWTYSDRYEQLATQLPTNHFMMKNGTSSKMYGNVCKYHPVWKASFNCRTTELASVEDLSGTQWDEKTLVYDMFNRSGGQGARFNPDFNLVVNNNHVPVVTPTTYKGVLKFNIVFRTTWRVYGSKGLKLAAD